jgi:hypothetical protein
MGYESKIYVVRKSNFNGTGEKKFAEKIAEFNLCKVYGVSNILGNMPKTNCYIYADDGNTEIIEDRYGEELTECTPAELLEIIENEKQKDDFGYWRYDMILATLRELVKLKDERLYCLHYGY